ncbi:MAG: DNA-directed RNA polymerase subunit L [Candidatus Diapherotrites archaeon]|nr:DNA-directed RNA polymerase subunit L [Candidatus Diapherotrites archaeon]
MAAHVMELEVKNSKKNELEFVLKGERHTLPNLLRSEMLEDDAVSFVAYKLLHPFDRDSVFIVKTDGKTAKKAVSDALQRIDKQAEEFRKAFKAELK